MTVPSSACTVYSRPHAAIHLLGALISRTHRWRMAPPITPEMGAVEYISPMIGYGGGQHLWLLFDRRLPLTKISADHQKRPFPHTPPRREGALTTAPSRLSCWCKAEGGVAMDIGQPMSPMEPCLMGPDNGPPRAWEALRHTRKGFGRNKLTRKPLMKLDRKISLE